MGLNLVHQFAHLSWPVMPVMAKKIHETIQPIGGYGDVIPWPDQRMDKALDELEAGQPINPPDVLFAKITDEQIAELKTRFGGSTGG
jgi:methionyl-tRNA synthetase